MLAAQGNISVLATLSKTPPVVPNGPPPATDEIASIDSTNGLHASSNTLEFFFDVADGDRVRYVVEGGTAIDGLRVDPIENVLNSDGTTSGLTLEPEYTVLRSDPDSNRIRLGSLFDLDTIVLRRGGEGQHPCVSEQACADRESQAYPG